MDKTIELVARYGFEWVSVNKICKALDIAKGTMYCHFETKEDLLNACFIEVNREISQFLVQNVLQMNMVIGDAEEILHQVWLKYFDFMIKNGTHSLFYYAYRQSERLDQARLSNNTQMAQTMAPTMCGLEKIIGKIDSIKDIPFDYLWAHIIDCTGVYVNHILRGRIPIDEVEEEKVWRLLFKGMLNS